eukprot:8665154-Pyramimonas_sp.AAC.1
MEGAWWRLPPPPPPPPPSRSGTSVLDTANFRTALQYRVNLARLAFRFLSLPIFHGEKPWLGL